MAEQQAKQKLLNDSSKCQRFQNDNIGDYDDDEVGGVVKDEQKIIQY
jgi:hypothetical protein